MPKRRTPIASITYISLGSLFCLGLLVGGYIVLSLPVRASEVFGPPAPQLDTNQRFRLSARLLWQADDLITPADPYGTPRSFQIALDESLPTIAERLSIEGLIHNVSAFRTYLQYTGMDTTIQAGNYELSPAMTPMEIAHSMQDATPKEVPFSILEGWRLEEIAAILPTSGLHITPEAFLDAASSVPPGHAILESLPANASLEGFLSPGTYQVLRDLTADELTMVLLINFETQLTYEIQEGFKRQDLTIFEAVTLASIVERETVVDNEMPLIASVFLNRLRINMKLEADSTVQYALGYNEKQNTWWTNPLSADDLRIDSAYNSYRYPGLNPGPIANPGLNALRAVAFPAQTPYYYFRAACDGSGDHLFAVTYDEHVRNACPED